jgi:predicted metal-dependent hydrolase
VSDPAGHLYGRPPEQAVPLDPQRWQENSTYLYAIDLFNHGFYWEAHETWEGLWHAAGRRGVTADFLKGLIQLAAAGVKVLQGQADGVTGHARRAAELFCATARAVGGGERFAGLSVADLIEAAAQAQRTQPAADTDAGVRAVFGFVLRPGPGG